MKNLFLNHVQDVGRENNKSATTFVDMATSKVLKVFTSVKPSLFNEVSQSFREKDVPVFGIREKTSDDNGVWKYYIAGDDTYASVVDNVINIIKIDGDENVIPNLPVFCMMDLIRNSYEMHLSLKEDFKSVVNVTIALTRKMRDLPSVDHIKQSMLKTKYECIYYPKGLGKTDLSYTHTFSFKYDVNKELKDNTSIQFNIQGSQSALAYIHDPKTFEYIPNIIGNAGFIENVDPNISDKMRKFIETGYSMDYLAIDCSSREMTINLLERNKSRFTASKTIAFGSYNIFEKMKEILNNIMDSKRLEISWIKENYMKNSTITNERLGKNFFGKDKFDKPSYTMAELYQIAYDKLHEKLYQQIITEYKNLTSFFPHINPEFVVLCGGGIYSNHGKQSPFVRLATDFVKDFLDKSIVEDKKCYSYILPHGLYPDGDSQYIIKSDKTPHFMLAHVLGTSLEFISNLEKNTGSKKK